MWMSHSFQPDGSNVCFSVVFVFRCVGYIPINSFQDRSFEYAWGFVKAGVGARCLGLRLNDETHNRRAPSLTSAWSEGLE